ncbi:MAG: hypothetical protein ABIK28_18295 [Planctomycetota bacterium]
MEIQGDLCGFGGGNVGALFQEHGVFLLFLLYEDADRSWLFRHTHDAGDLLAVTVALASEQSQGAAAPLGMIMEQPPSQVLISPSMITLSS